ncbi:tyrosine recombinase XerS [Ligilactobacillus agilis]|uniref:Tyrosine recombinase XerS n=1 Tax=Ligilactobacillus agilis TaxID=1601 RepID=A0A6F9XJJ9_9LACO|nr:tyrosine recombinase XerS [Ligilactobacillus agilis]GET05441.1 tyrosine recombinase XerS [Ligilactobacillus agilis]
MTPEQYNRLKNNLMTELPPYVRNFVYTSQKSNSTIYQYLSEIKRFFQWLISAGISDETDVKDITIPTLAKIRKSDILAFIDELASKPNRQGRTNSPVSINRSLNCLRTFFNYLAIDSASDTDNGQPLLLRSPMLGVASMNSHQTLSYRAKNLEDKMYLGNLKFEFLDFINKDYENTIADNKHKLTRFKQNKVRDLALIALMAGTGVRVSEAANANVQDLSITKASLTVVRKGGERDAVPIAPWTLPYLNDYVQNRETLYPNVDKEQALFVAGKSKVNRISTAAIENLVAKYSQAFGRPITPHKLRHTIASELYQISKDQVAVAQQLGQKGTSATALYTHVQDEVRRDMLQQISQSTPNKTQ